MQIFLEWLESPNLSDHSWNLLPLGNFPQLIREWYWRPPTWKFHSFFVLIAPLNAFGSAELKWFTHYDFLQSSYSAIALIWDGKCPNQSFSNFISAFPIKCLTYASINSTSYEISWNWFIFILKVIYLKREILYYYHR